MEEAHCGSDDTPSFADLPHCKDIFGPDYSFPPKPKNADYTPFIYNCDPDGSKGLIPATVNTIGATSCSCSGAAVMNDAGTSCLCESPNVGTPGDCVAPSTQVCGDLNPAKFYDAGAGECVAVAVCASPAVLDAGTNRCDCPSPNVGTDGAAAPGDCAAPSVGSCGGLTPAQFYDSGAGECVAVAVCASPAVRNAGTNRCDCPSPNIGTDGAVAPGDCVAPSAQVCGELSPAKFYDSGAGECVAVAVCASPAVRNAGTNRCDCPAPNVGTDGAAAPGDCAAPSVGSCGGLNPAQFYDSGAGECVAVAVCTLPAVLNAGTNRCDCPAPNVGTDGAAAPGDCAAPSVGSCGGLNPAQFYEPAAGECVEFAVCASPAVLNAGTNSCDCPAPNVGTDGAFPPGDCAAPSVGSCGGLNPAQFYDSGAGECVEFAVCASPAVLNARTNSCDCPAPNVGTDGAVAPGDCAAPSVGSCGGLSPAKFYDAGAGACVAVAACIAPAVLDAAANLCDCPSPNIGTDDAAAPGDCAVPVPSAGVCGGLTPPQFYSETLSACVPFAACQGGATLNAGANRCDCPAGSVRRVGLCTPESDDFGELSDELLCGAFGGTVRTATGGREVCSGMDANDTFCIMDSAVGFPCRGLFKHLRSCNVKFNRKALNPFFCGEKCGVQKAVGSECR